MGKIKLVVLVCSFFFHSCSTKPGRDIQSSFEDSPFVGMCRDRNSPKEIKKTIGYLKRMVTKTFSKKNVTVNSEYHSNYDFPRYEFNEEELYDYNKVEGFLIKHFNSDAISCEETRKRLSLLESLEIATLPPNKIAMNRTKRSTWTIKGITDISPLAEFTNLKYLHLGQNSIRSLEPLKGMVKLEVLKAGKNDIEDVSPISELSKLKVLELFENMIEDISPLKDLIELEYLSVFGNFLGRDLKHSRMSLKNRTQQEKVNLETFNNFSNLNFLAASGNGFSTMSYFRESEKLRYLNMSNNKIQDLDNLKGMLNLKYLVLKKNRITNIEPLRDLNKLISLKLSGEHNLIKCWAPLGPLNKLNKSAYFTINHKIGGIANREKDGLEIGDAYTCIKCGNLNKMSSNLVRRHCKGLGKYSKYFCEERPFNFCSKRTCASRCKKKFNRRNDRAICRKECLNFINGVKEEIPRLKRSTRIPSEKIDSTAFKNMAKRHLKKFGDHKEFFIEVRSSCWKKINLDCN
jgi:hypothetical protein